MSYFPFRERVRDDSSCFSPANAAGACCLIEARKIPAEVSQSNASGEAPTSLLRHRSRAIALWNTKRDRRDICEHLPTGSIHILTNQSRTIGHYEFRRPELTATAAFRGIWAQLFHVVLSPETSSRTLFWYCYRTRSHGHAGWTPPPPIGNLRPQQQYEEERRNGIS